MNRRTMLQSLLGSVLIADFAARKCGPHLERAALAADIEALKAREREEHPLHVITLASTLSDEEREQIRRTLERCDSVFLLPLDAKVELLEPKKV